MTFPGLEMTTLKFHDFSRFSMTVRTLIFARVTRLLRAFLSFPLQLWSLNFHRSSSLPESLRLWSRRSARPLHHLLIRVLALTTQNWINLRDLWCRFPSRGQIHITVLSARRRHALFNEISFLPISCLSLCLYLPLARCINPGVIFHNPGLSYRSSLSLSIPNGGL